MARKEIIIASALTVAGLAGGYWLLPKDADVAQMEVRDYNYSAPEQLFEERFAAGDHSVDVVQQLVRIHTNTGKIDRALEVLEVYVESHPEDTAALKQLGTLYQHAQRYQDYMHILEARADTGNDPVVLAELSQLYNFFQQPEKQKATLLRLHKVEGGSNPATLRDLASLHAVDDEFAETAALMDELRDKHPDLYVYEDAVMHTNALLKIRQPEKAVDVVGFWRDQDRSQAADISFLVDMLHYQGAPKYASALLASIPQEEISASPELLHSYLLLMLANGRQEEAYELLLSLYEKGRLPDMLLPDLMYMAAVNNNVSRFEELHRKAGLARLPQNQLADIWLTAKYNNQRNVARAVEKHVGASEHNEYPLVSTMILIGNQSPARHAALRNLLEESSLDNESLLKLASISAHMGYRSDAQRALSKLPSYDKLSSSEIAALEVVYLRLKDKDAARKYAAYLRDSDRVEPSSPIGLRTAAYLGDAATLTAWHNAHGKNASSELLNDLFYYASDAGHLQLALEMAAWPTDPRQQAQARRNIADVYTRLGRYESALALLEQEAPRNEDDVRNRAFLLSKLAPRSTAHRERLHGLAKQWFKPGTSRRTKEELTYALLSTGKPQTALPYMKSLADQYGGEWTLAYADTLVQTGRGDEATPYYLQAAKDPKLDATTRMNIAYALANGGQREAAEQLLTELAEMPETQKAATNQLAYLWGPRPSDTQMDWLVQRWQQAEGEDKQAYAELLADKMTPDILESRVAHTPELRRIRQLDSNYIHMLAEQDRLRPEMETIARYAQESGDTAYLVYLANVARDYGAYADARYGYDQVLTVTPEDQPALIGSTLTAAAQADYAAISTYFQRYAVLAPTPPEMVTADTHEAYFAYAENLRRQQKLEEARPYYAQAISFIETSRLHDAESLSIAAQSNAWLGNAEESGKIFDYAFSRHPQSAVLHADKTALLIEQHRYDDAYQAWNHIQTPVATDNAPKPLTTAMLTSGDTGLTQAPQVMDEGRQLLVRTTPENTAPRYWVNNLRTEPSISYITEGYDSVLLVSKVGYRFEISQPNGSDWMANAVENPAMASRSEQAQLQLRKELLAARLDLETGRLKSAANRMDTLEETYAEDPQYLGFAANTYYYANMWPTAKTLIEDAATRSPDNADIKRLQRDIERNHPDHVRADVTLVNRGDNREIVTSLSSETQATRNWRIGGIVRNHDLKTDDELQPNGTIGSRSDDRQSMELYGIYAVNRNAMLTARLFANNDTPGVGLDYSFINPLGVTTIGGRYHEPYFEFIEGIMDNAVRDRIAIGHVVKPRTDWEVNGTLSYNNYSIEDADNIMDTFGVQLGITHALRQSQPYIGIGYGLDAEYEIDNTFQQTTLGQSYRQMPLRSREIHFGSVTVAHDFSDKTYGSLLAGYGWDRLGGSGPGLEGTINHEFYKNWDVGGRAFYGMNASNSEDDVNMLNGYVRYRF